MHQKPTSATDKIQVAFHTLGCKLNFAETAEISKDFSSEHYDRVEFDQPADVYIINTCSVTENADKRFKALVAKVLRQNDQAFVAAIGCYAQLQPEALADVAGVDLVLGASEKFNLTHYLSDLTKRSVSEVHSCEIEDVNEYQSSFSTGDRTRAFLKVQDGCDYKCSYCTIPLARGISRSDTVANVAQKAEEIATQSIKEIVLTGVNIGDFGKGEYGLKKHDDTFLDLVVALDTIKGIERIRISSIEPNLLKNEIIDFVGKSAHFVPHFHIPLQSGSDRVLKKMRRRYLSKLYVDRVQQIKQVMPHACIGVDVIVGFPGETEEEFLTTYRFLADLDISYLHVFTYSERPNTEAIHFDEVVPMSTRNKRSKLLRGLSVKKRHAFYLSQLGTTQQVLWEGENKKGYIHGFTSNYVKMRKIWDPAAINTLENVCLSGIDNEGFVRTEA
ncbi:tRNA (N(6)-L-threonylcarbamoyladenosine(37)-C(2))-methylthiotransferase MtaB [Flavobacteriaceae bacterium]|nr:tRNA (N(6)-L-threonylcarbamoyladenosine(37)-C(2))-methylthiotransferase MtaB [Flavobacteriaceae bacterium]